MSVNHEPRDEFEKQAAKQIAAGKDEFEQVEAGYYRRAAPIPLAAGCVACHSGFSASAAKTPRFAGLVIRIPVHE
jgi:cytochrome c553